MYVTRLKTCPRYGALEGLSKPELASLMGEEQVQMWRNGLIDRFACVCCLYKYNNNNKPNNYYLNIITHQYYYYLDLVNRPPPMTEDHIHWHKNERKYHLIDPNVLPSTESLQDVLDRVEPLWKSDILPDLKNGRNVLIVAHNSSIKGMYNRLVTLIC